MTKTDDSVSSTEWQYEFAENESNNAKIWALNEPEPTRYEQYMQNRKKLQEAHCLLAFSIPIWDINIHKLNKVAKGKPRNQYFWGHGCQGSYVRLIHSKHWWSTDVLLKCSVQSRTKTNFCRGHHCRLTVTITFKLNTTQCRIIQEMGPFHSEAKPLLTYSYTVLSYSISFWGCFLSFPKSDLIRLFKNLEEL